MENLPKLLNFKDTALYLGIPQRALRQWVAGREIPFMKVGKRLFFSTEALELWVKDKLVLPTSASTLVPRPELQHHSQITGTEYGTIRKVRA